MATAIQTFMREKEKSFLFKKSPRDPDFSVEPIYVEGLFTSRQRASLLEGSPGDIIAAHHRHQIPLRDGGVMDELRGLGHPLGNSHTKGTLRDTQVS